MSTDTIAAVGTALSNSGISIIRISGKNSLNIIKKIFKSKKKLEANSIIYGSIYNGEKILDKVLVSYFKSPNSFTGEDVCEINCHGGIQITKQILELVLLSGARLAEPGEFSKRSFLNGKMDLSQAEAVIDLINAKTKTQTSVFSRQLEGQLSKKVIDIREKLIELLAHISVSIDYPEYDYEEVDPAKVLKSLDNVESEINILLKSYDSGKYIKDGINVCLIGKPNVGKSSILNALANYEKAIVTDIPGTTRDIVEETITLGPLTINISDTAGIRNTDDIIEKIGVEKSMKKLEESDLVIFILSAEERISKEEISILSNLQKKGIKFITVINKSDKIEKSIFDTVLDELSKNNILDPILTSTLEKNGVDSLKNKIIEKFDLNDFDYEHELIIMNERHRDLLKSSVDILREAKEELKNNNPIDIISISITKVSDLLGKIIGANVSEDVINKIFEKFCLGK